MGKKTIYTVGTVAVVVIAAGAFAILHHPTKAQTHKDATVGDFKISYTNNAKPIKDGTLKIGLFQDEPFTGIFAPDLISQTVDGFLTGPLGSGLFKNDESYKIVDGGAANFKLDKATKSATITLRKGVTWSDGKPVTAKDLEFAYEIVANQAYGGITYTDTLANIKGMAAYHAGKAKTISGITYPNGETGNSIKLQFGRLTPSMEQTGSGNFLESAEPYHYMKDIAPAKLAGSKAVRQAPLSWGPFKVEKIIAGQSVQYVRNPYYYGPKAKLARIDTQVSSSASAAAALKAKKFDIAYGQSSTAYPKIKALTDYVQTGKKALSFSATYFNLGHYDTKKGVNVQDRKTPLQNTALRQALGYALNIEQVNKKFSNGLKTRANSTIPTAIKGANDKSVKGFPLDVKKANSLLDKAGFKWDAKHEYRLNTDGKPFQLTYMAQNSTANSEPIAQNNIQQWKAVGVKVHLYKDRLTDFNSWAQVVTSGTGDWDITDGSWSINPDPSPADLFSVGAQYNLGHYVSPELTKILTNIDSTKALDPTYRKAQVNAYQQYVQKEAVVIPQSFGIGWIPVNKRVIGWTNEANSYNDYATLAVSANSPE
ncbi:oligopeptide ABC transporter substrate-binding protein [Periweissella cryptocerci]|uniref:Oligopeptide ABC transporter substrate-binding protein n=1 Tax=Periweissella cryptocerci TaxID=2506420 RepID=A0A4P6YRE2_9LACO|nr:ABC transporter substrate-binding protein [Periweissella cryptocerci]QBO35207.1 oligopeptide ABC transporter substrate-binding protein [Periweissella cryptocerci]